MTDICTVCGEATSEGSSATCSGCNEPFHLALREGTDSPECGRVWVHEQFMTLEYGCLRCLDGATGQSSINGAAFVTRGPAGRRRYRKVR
jgi:hypothetical protein